MRVATAGVRGVSPEYGIMRAETAEFGRFLNHEDIENRRRVAFLGYEIARRMRALSAARHAMLVAVTGQARPEALRAARAAGFDRVLAKPVGLVALQTLLGPAPRA